MYENRKRWMMLPLLVASLTPLTAVAQEMTAGVQGIVKDPSGSLVPNAAVEISSSALIGNKKTTTTAGGEFRFAALPPGKYDLTVAASGFRTFVQHSIDLA